ncbi:MAG TPA: shikimate dehydrogenase [Devosia sp.]|uniref:shikimate dehydrogenase n=1 Tax=Devosia sp. TaxID=1871048 RepID=UPI002DDCE470|nr:shikimate dehydrogenase [Devosia sp.]HEV2516315.1 shikimate dehydrogenase [Devosia sp.]
MISAVVDEARRQLGDLVATRRKAPSAGGRQFVVGLLGRGIQASKTPRMHELEGRRIGFDYTYVLIDFDTLGLADHDLGAMIELAEALGFAGLNVTHPFKQAVLPLLDDLAPEAAAIGAVNTVVFGTGRRLGHNTDSWGFAESFREGLAGASMEAIVQFGAGGAGAAVGHALLSLGGRKLTLCETELDRAKRLAERLGERFGAEVEVTDDPAIGLAGATGVVNTTPVGMAKYPGLAFPGELLRASHWVAEIIYFPADTALLQAARRLGCRTLGGTGMAVYQAVKAFELFTGTAPDRAAMLAHFEAESR